MSANRVRRRATRVRQRRPTHYHADKPPSPTAAAPHRPNDTSRSCATATDAATSLPGATRYGDDAPSHPTPPEEPHDDVQMPPRHHNSTVEPRNDHHRRRVTTTATSPPPPRHHHRRVTTAAASPPP
ncbi:hypothetical protein DXG01_006790, partial [Tephrocybe rancida]